MPNRCLRLVLPVLAAAALTAAAPANNAIKEPDKLVVLSLTDVMGRMNPCGCEVPKGGFARQAAFADSVRAQFDQVVMVDAGGYFPDSAKQETAIFMMETMKTLDYAAVGTGARDLRFGLDVLRDNVRRTGLPQVSANLYLKALDKPALTPWVVKEVGTVKVGFFSLISDRLDLGPSRAQLVVKDPYETARAAVAALKARGATVIVLLSQVGKLDTEELVSAIPGIDVAIVGLNAPVNPIGRMLGKTLLTYGGEQGQHMGVSILDLARNRTMATGASEVHPLVKEVGERAHLLERVKAFEASRKSAAAAK